MLTGIPRVTHVRSTLDGAPKLERLDEEAARLAGLDNATIAAALQSNLSGLTGGSLLEATEELPIRVRVAGETRGNVGGSRPSGCAPPAARGRRSQSVAIPETAAIAHRNRRRVRRPGFLEAGVLPEILAERRTGSRRRTSTCPRLRVEVGGEREARRGRRQPRELGGAPPRADGRGARADVQLLPPGHRDRAVSFLSSASRSSRSPPSARRSAS